MEIKLTKEDKILIQETAEARYNTNRSVKRKNGAVLKSYLKADLIGAAGELVVSKAFGLSWDGRIKSDKEWLKWRKEGHDVCQLEVRSTKYKTGRLILHDKDPDDSPFILVTVGKDACKIVGWCYGREGKKKEWWDDPGGYNRPCYLVPQNKLRKVNELLEILNEAS